MRSIAVLSLAVATTATAKKPRWNELEGYTFEQYKDDHGKKYSSPQEEARRKEIFERNLEKIKGLNAKPGMTWRAGVNMFTDKTEAEFKSYNKAKNVKYDLEKDYDQVIRAPAADEPPMPLSVDWRKTPGVLGPVRHQGNCGSCWAHAAAETISSQYNILTGQGPTLLSVGQINSCTTISDGCDGGFAESAYRQLASLAKDNQGPKVLQSLTEEWAYPFPNEDFFSFDGSGKTSKCQDISQAWHNKSSKTIFFELNAAGVSGVGAVDSNSATGGPAAMKALRDVGPLSISVAAGNWQWYQEGVFQNNATNGQDAEWQVDHAVQMVGYGYDKELDQNFWLVRNSWSTLWGEDGFIRLWRAKDGEKEPCAPGSTTTCGTSGCLNGLSYPIVYKADPIKFG